MKKLVIESGVPKLPPLRRVLVAVRKLVTVVGD
jgi:hypothetical protein